MEAQGLYHPSNEHDACGVGFIAHIKGVRTHSMGNDSIVARGCGSIAVMRVSSLPSATARAMKRVEWPQPTSTTRRGRVARTTA